MQVPRHFTANQRKIWRRTLSAAEHITEADRDVLASYCTTVDYSERLTVEAQTADLTTESTRETLIAHPIHRELRETNKELRQLATALRLTPASRTEAPPAPKSSLTDLADRRAEARGRAAHSA